MLLAQTRQISFLQSENEDFRVWGLSSQGHTDKDTLFIFSADRLKKKDSPSHIPSVASDTHAGTQEITP